jgi:hypothetical protein
MAGLAVVRWREALASAREPCGPQDIENPTSTRSVSDMGLVNRPGLAAVQSGSQRIAPSDRVAQQIICQDSWLGGRLRVVGRCHLNRVGTGLWVPHAVAIGGGRRVDHPL